MNILDLCQNAANAKKDIIKITESDKNKILVYVADYFKKNIDFLLTENNKDIENAKANNMSEGLIDRLKLTEDRIIAMADGLIQISNDLKDPVGEILDEFDRPNGLKIQKVRVPLGVIGIIFESRPNVTADAFGLCFKTSNVVILKGGSDAINSNRAIIHLIKEGLKKGGVNENIVNFIDSTDRKVTTEFMNMKEYVDVLIPRGGAGLIKAVVENSSIPVIETGTGNCHIYIDENADFEMAKNIIINAKTQRIGVCNACESLVIHKNVPETVVKEIGEALINKNVEIRADKDAKLILDCNDATEDDFAKEYLDYIISVKTVNNIDEAIEHINKYHTKHSDAIITNNAENAEKFLNEIDSACVYVNASTRFTDGFEFGFGAEIGISTQMLHARGPMGLKELTTYKYKIKGNGQVRG